MASLAPPATPAPRTLHRATTPSADADHDGLRFGEEPARAAAAGSAPLVIGMCAAANSSVQRSTVIAREATTPAAKFIEAHGHPEIVKGLADETDPQNAFRVLVSNFFDRNDFTYTTNNKPKWGGQGDCATLVSEFIEAAGFWGIKAEAKSFSAPVIYVTPRGIVDHSCANGNIDDGTGGWIFESHTWVSTPYGEADILFGQLGAVDYSLGTEGKDAMGLTTCIVNGVEYGFTEGAAHYRSRWTSDRTRWFGAKKKK